MEEIAESIEDVRGGGRPISTRCEGAVAAMGGDLVIGDEEEPPMFRTGSETLRGVAFVSCNGRPYLMENQQAVLKGYMITVIHYLEWLSVVNGFADW